MSFNHVLLQKSQQPFPLRQNVKKLRLIDESALPGTQGQPALADNRPLTSVNFERIKFESIRSYVKAKQKELDEASSDDSISSGR